MARTFLASVALLAFMAPATAQAAPLDGAALSWPWALPFVGILTTIAVAPLLAPKFWQRHYGKLAFIWAALAVVPLAALYDLPTALAAFLHTMLADYMSFIVLLFALYVVAGGILVTGNLRGTPLVNTALLALGAVIASLVGTTGAAMILIRPLLRANAARLHNAHVIVFFIFLAANIGGSLTPFGNPPLFVGFLQGVDFFWTAQHLAAPTAVAAALVLAAFLIVDLWLYRHDRKITTVGEAQPPVRLRLRGRVNFLLIAGIVAAIFGSAFWRPGVHIEVYGTTLELQNLVRDAALVLIAVLSLVLTPNEHREANGFTWEPIAEVAMLFGGIFACIIPVLAMLQAGSGGAFSWLLAAATAEGGPNDVAYFWLTGALSAFLDNAPTYLVFFALAGGDPTALMGPLASTLAAISMGATYMGALTYLGNAPNLMIYAIAVERGVKMPSFFGFMIWSCTVLLPVFWLITYLFVWRT
ncbi:MAG TPA: sodium:proton antiporter [Xanthobacteraceae bacterium]|nr:sodium:proton antiporter [Xanthobacteraceae bacterium]